MSKNLISMSPTIYHSTVRASSLPASASTALFPQPADLTERSSALALGTSSRSIPLPGSSSTALKTEISPPTLQVFLVTAPAHDAYRERFLANAKGWHRDFPDLQVYTFDEVPTNIPALNDATLKIRQIPKLEAEKEKMKGTNLLLAAFGAIYEHNPNADFYFLTEDDTILVKQNIEHAVMRLAPRKNVYIGKCVKISTKKMGNIEFVMGGAGILMSGDLLRQMAPKIETCREQYREFQHGDVRIAACLKSMNILPRQVCTWNNAGMNGFHFSSSSAWREASYTSAANSQVVTIHEKSVERIRILNEAIADLSHQNATWGLMKPYLDAFAGNRTDMY